MSDTSNVPLVAQSPKDQAASVSKIFNKSKKPKIEAGPAIKGEAPRPQAASIQLDTVKIEAKRPKDLAAARTDAAENALKK